MTNPPGLDRVVVINDRSVRMGGASNLAILSANLLQDVGVAVTFFAGDVAGADRPVPDTINLAAQPLMQQPRLSALVSGLYNRQAHDGLGDVISRIDTPGTIYHLHGWSKILSPSVFRALWPVRARVFAVHLSAACAAGVSVACRWSRRSSLCLGRGGELAAYAAGVSTSCRRPSHFSFAGPKEK